MIEFIIWTTACLTIGWYGRVCYERTGGRNLIPLDPNRLPPLRQGDRMGGIENMRLVGGEVVSQYELMSGLCRVPWQPEEDDE